MTNATMYHLIPRLMQLTNLLRRFARNELDRSRRRAAAAAAMSVAVDLVRWSDEVCPEDD